MKTPIVSALAALALVAAGCNRPQASGEEGAAPPAAPPPSEVSATEEAPAPTPATGLDVQVTTLEGEKRVPREVMGETTLVTVWASYCPPCIAELPLLEKLHAELADEPGLKVIALGLDAPEVAQRILEKQGVKDLPVYLAPDMATARFLSGIEDPKGPVSLPLAAYIGPDGALSHTAGLITSQSPEEFVAHQKALLARARAGTLPAGSFPPGKLPPEVPN